MLHILPALLHCSFLLPVASLRGSASHQCQLLVPATPSTVVDSSFHPAFLMCTTAAPGFIPGLPMGLGLQLFRTTCVV